MFGMLDVKLNRSLYKSSAYRGSCDVFGRRDGFGSELWRAQEQIYEGSFARDAFHGEGSYKWLATDCKQVYEGYFYSNFKEGYGLVSLPDGSVFEGLFCNSRPFGPGVQTYVNGRQDVGFWCGQRLVRLSRSVDFIIPRLASSPSGKLKLLQFQTLVPYVEENADVGSVLQVKFGFDPSQTHRLYSSFVNDPRSLFFNKISFDKVLFVKMKDLSTRSHPSDLVSVTGEDATFYPTEDEAPADGVSKFAANSDADGGEADEENQMGILRYQATHKTLDGFPIKWPRNETGGADSKEDVTASSREHEDGRAATAVHLISWNRSELCMKMLKEIFRFRSFEDNLSFKISDLMSGVRTKFRKTGDGERCCLQFLKMCSIGPAHIVKDFLCTKNISEALTDANGNNSIMFAAAADQHDIIELLLNYGADVNSFNDENLTPLNFCLLRRIAQADYLGNWEVAFLPPEKKAAVVDGAKNSEWKVKTPVESLDRIFGDGMSIDDSKCGDNKIRENWIPHENDSAFCFKGEDDFQSSESDVTLFKYKKSSDFVAMEVLKRSSVGKSGETEKLREHFVPESYKREEFVKSVAAPTEKDKYFFELSPGKAAAGTYHAKAEKKATAPAQKATARVFRSREKAGEAAAVGEMDEEEPEAFSDRIANIDRTIELLLKRGADPNLADAPKPSLHLAVYSKDVRLVRLLLMYGASPDSQSLPQEGLLTPLHVLVLMKPARELVEMCKLLLNYGASPEEETSPDFNPNDDDESLLDPEHGRTPLQLLCMRRDAEYADPEEFLSQLAVLLAGVSRRNHFFKGHSYLTLAMISGNHTLVKALLMYKKADPNEILGQNLGTPLHVLVSTTMQKRTSYEESVEMCDTLLKNGGNPNVEFKAPPSLAGTCVDYGYREIQEEKLRQQQEAIDSKRLETKRKSEVPERDSVDSHERIVEYLAKKSDWQAKVQEPRNEVSKPNFDEDQRKGKANSSGLNGKGQEGANELRGRKGGASLVRANAEDSKGSMKNEPSSSKPGKTKAQDIKKYSGELGLGSEKKAPPEHQTKIIEIKKHVATSKDKGSKGSRRGGNGWRRPEGSSSDTKGARKGSRRESKEMAGGGATAISTKNKRSSDTRRTHLSERLPERFRHSLLHMFGVRVGGFDLNELLLPYIVLRNGDLYYRFKGQKPALVEQYSLI